LQLPKIEGFSKNPQFLTVNRPIAAETVAGRYNNFYEFGGGKNIWLKAQKLPTNPWTVEVGGLVKNPQTYDIDTIKKTFPLEERIYRFRCVEAWSMVLPWLGFPMSALIAAVEPKPEAKFVRFTSFYNPEITKGPGLHLGALPWPYTEGLRIANAGTSDPQTSFFYDTPTDTWFYQTSTPYVRLNFDPTVSLNEESAEINGVSLYPNPSNSETNVNFYLQTKSDVTILVTDLTGKTVSSLELSNLTAGTNSTKIDCSSLNSGVYYVTINTNGSSVTKKFVKK
jgi:hypothetical protein